MPEDPLAIAGKAGEGDAVIFKPQHQDLSDFLAQDLEDRKRALKERHAQAAKDQEEKFKQFEELSKTGVNGVVKDRNYLLDQKASILDSSAKYLTETKGKGDISLKFGSEIAGLKSDSDVAKKIQEDADKVSAEIANPKNKYTPESVKAIAEFMDKPFPEKKSYLEKNGGSIPQPVPVKEDIDFISAIDKGAPDINSFQMANGDTHKFRDPKQIEARANLFAEAGLNGSDKAYEALAHTEDTMLMRDNQEYKVLKNMPDQASQLKAREILKNATKSFIITQWKSKGGEGIDKAAPKEDKVDASKNVNVTYDVTPSGDHVVNFSKADVNENKPLDFVIPGGYKVKSIDPKTGAVESEGTKEEQVINGVPIRFEERKGQMPVLIVSQDVKEASPDDPTKMITVRKKVEIPYDIASPKIKDEYGFNFEDIKQGGVVPKNVHVNDYSKHKVEVKSDAPHGERVKTKDGMAVWDGKKYVLEK